jgi:hypothetical protein
VDELKAPDKPFEISKRAVWEAWEKVKANKGAPGVDGQTIAEFEKIKNNLFKVWNRISSGSYFPPPVRAVEIEKAHGGGTRIIGVPTVADRIAQRVVAGELERKVDPIFHPDSYGYPAQALRARRRGDLPGTVLEDELGDRSGHPEILRQRAMGPGCQGRRGEHRPAVDGAVYQTVAQSAAGAARRLVAGPRPGDPCSPASTATSNDALKKISAQVRSWATAPVHRGLPSGPRPTDQSDGEVG